MKKLTAIILTILSLTAPSFAAGKTSTSTTQPPSYVRCAVWLIPAQGCTMDERIIGGAIMTAAIGTGVGAIWAAAGIGAAIGAGTGAIAPLVIR